MDIDNLYQKDSLPKLFKNRIKQGPRYYEAVRATVIAKSCFPYTPTDPPDILKEIVKSDPLYVCDQCKDCFRFESSFEDHINRRSWILGFWCYMCFTTVCAHGAIAGTACLLCQKRDSDKRANRRGRHFTKKLGVVKVFYNQCQFFKHLETHNCNTVDLGTLMLAPLPAALMENDWPPEFETACEALLDHAFSSRIHINDWFKKNNMENTWWELINDRNEDNLIYKVIKRYSGRQVFRTLNESDHFPDSCFIDLPLTESVSPPCNESPNTSQETNNNFGTHPNRSANEDNSYTSGIAFIDCGQTARDFIPAAPSYVSKARQTDVAEPSQQVTRKMITVNDIQQLEKSTSNNYKNVSGSNSNQTFIIGQSSESASVHQRTNCNITQPMNKITITAAPETATGSDAPNNSLASNIPAKTSLTNNSSKMVTIQDPKNIALISNQLSPFFAPNNKIVILEEDNDKIFASATDKVPTDTTCTSPSSNGNTGVNTPLQTCDARTTKQQIERQIMTRKEKTYPVKNAESATNNVNRSTSPLLPKTKTPPDSISTTSTDKATSSKVANGVERVVSPSNIAACLTLPAFSEASTQTSTKPPSASKSKKKSHRSNRSASISDKVNFLSSSLSLRKSRTIETLTLVRKGRNNVYMETELQNRGTLEYRLGNFRNRIFAYSCRMIEDFERMDISDQEECLRHLESVKEELRSVLSFLPSNILDEKLKKVNFLQQTLEQCRRKADGIPAIGVPGNQDDPKLADWESEATRRNVRCAECDKPIKPDTYIPGFSKLSEHEFDYCLCYKQVCHECRTYEGDINVLPRFVQHRNVHKRSPPHMCPDCQTTFSSAVSLEAHTWTACFHTMRKRFFSCKLCEIDGFRDMESVTRHYVVMHSATKTGCNVCLRVFPTYRECVDHSAVHSVRSEPIRLVECKVSDVTVRWENYMTYLGDFRGVRKVTFFKCSFCPLINRDNKYAETLMNQHIRSSHFVNLAETVSSETFTAIFKTKSVNQSRTCVKINKNCVVRCVDTSILKIVNTQTISSEIFEKDSSSVNTENFGSHFGDTKTCASNSNAANDNEDDGKAKETLPKILDVVSMAELSPSAIEGRIILPTTNSESLHAELAEAEDEKAIQREDAEETAIEVDVFKSEIAEETEATETPDAINAKLPLWIPESEKPPLTDVDNVRPNLPSAGLSNSKSGASAMSRIKVVDIKKICKPDVAPLIDAEMRDARAEDTSSKNPIPALPPLVKIPQRIVEAIEAASTIAEPSDYSGNVARSRGPAPTVARTRIAVYGTRNGDVEYACHLCRERITTSWSVVRRHFDEKHSDECRLTAVSARVSRMSPDFVNGGYKAFTYREKRKADTSQPTSFVSKRKRRRATKKR